MTAAEGAGGRVDLDQVSDTDIAIVGMALHVPGARDPSAFWHNLREGVESIRRLSEDELLAAGESPDRIRHPNYVPAAAPLEGFDEFDAEFFGFSPKEAAILDPQHRQFLETAWEALENAGHPPERFPGPIGVFAGCGMGSYFYFNICSNPDLVDQVGMFLLRHTGNDKDFLATRVSHIFDLKGPSVNIQTACSTSLAATHYACQALLGGECDMALAGGATVELPHARGYLFQEGEILSPDGHCHAFDHRAQGTVFGSGAAVVALRRLKDALADGDHVWAVIKGTAVNNDGAAKAGYLAPSVDGQAAAIAEAHAVAGVGPDTIGYVECHGTGTYLGDPIEVAALTDAFRRGTDKTGFCRIGSVKTNIGHLDTAAGAASLIKTALALHEGEIPPSLGYEAPNPAIDFESSPFQVADALTPWPRGAAPRRAGVNSLGVGGTNVHAVLEEAPAQAASEPSDWPFQPIVLSARSRKALDEASAALAAHLRAHPEQDLADVAFTLKEGRRAFEKRRVLVAADREEAARLLEERPPRRVFDHEALAEPEVVFMFPGGGAQYVNMARDLYETEPVFADWMDKGLEILAPLTDHDPRALWLPEPGAEAEAAERLRRPSAQLPLIMIVEYALAQLWMSWGVRPAALVGHSMGENVAACLAGVMSFEDCIRLVHLRGRLFDEAPAGGMLSVPISAQRLAPLLGEELDVASVNAPELTVASGPQAALDALQARLAELDIEAQRIPIDIAAHSRMLDPLLARFGDFLRGLSLSPPRIPIVSNRTGKVLTDAEATDPDHWVRHLRGTVRFADCIGALAERPGRVFLEVGPGKALGAMARMHGAVPAQQVIDTLRHPDEAISDDAYFLGAVARLWALGVEADWTQIWGEARRRRVPLPTYPFQRARYFIEPGVGAHRGGAERPARIDDIARWGARPVWRPKFADCPVDLEEEGALEAALAEGAAPRSWLFFMDEAGLAARAAARLRAAGAEVIEVRAGDAFARTGEDAYVIAPERGREDYDLLVRDLVERGRAPQRIAHFWLTTAKESFRPGSSFFHRNQEQGFYALTFLAQAIAAEGLPAPLHMTVVTSGAARVKDEPLPHPEKAAVAGPARVIPRELPGVTCATLDVALPGAGARAGGPLAMLRDPFAGRRAAEAEMDLLAERVLEDLLAAPACAAAALRGERRFELEWRPMPLPEAPRTPILPEGGVCLITGGFGGVGLTVAERLARESRARLVLVSRTPPPPREEWAALARALAPDDPRLRRIRAVERLEALGAQVMPAAADVCDLEQMRAVLAEAERRFGPVQAVIHAAGAVRDAPLMTKTPSAIEDVFAPKIHGLQVLQTLFFDEARKGARAPLDWMALFSSTSTVIAPAGQVDYVAANEYLNAWAQAHAGGPTRVVAIDWGVWAEVGMAAEAMAAREAGDAAPREPVAGAPLLDVAAHDESGARLFEAEWRPEDRWALDEHRTAAGDALLPGTGYLELAAEALAAHGQGGPFVLRDLWFLRPLHAPDGAAPGGGLKVRVRLRRTDEGYAFDVLGACSVEGRPAFQLHAQGRIAPGAPAPAAPLDLAAVEARCDAARRADPAGIVSPQEAHLRFGPRWRVLRALALGRGEGLARLALPEAARADLDAGWLLHPALMDLATGWAMELIPGYAPTHLWAPISYEEVRVHAPLEAEVASHVRLVEADADGARFDVLVADPAGRVLVEAKGFAIKRLENADFARPRPPSAREVEFDRPSAAARARSPAEEALAHALSQGIRPEEGAEAFVRAMAAGRAQLAVSSMDLGALAAQAAAAAPAEEDAARKFARPELEGGYVAPRTDLERSLAGFWEDLLGVDKVGVEDSFFDLGGHSLIAVRLFARIKKSWGVDFPISTLFEAPSVAALAALIAERLGVDPAAGDDAAPEAEAPRAAARPARRFTHLVPMHERDGGAGAPMFLVAGMFGNVMNLRHLAQLVGAERPFYGLQARGLYGDQPPHETFEEAARDCIAEMRQVHPGGPWLLGGFSGGGITAYEIARQLREAGEEVALLALLDTPLPMREPLSARDRALLKWGQIRQGGPAYLARWARERIAWEAGKLRARMDEPASDEPVRRFHDEAIEAAFLAALPRYRMHPWDGPLTLFRPPLRKVHKVSGGRWVDDERAYVLEDNGWTRWAPATEVVEVPGDHDSMVLEPNVRVLAARLRARILAAEAAAGRAGAPRAAAAE
ncbi:type I polyketide synthase [Oceanicella actignis]|uniref:type I polyketide synthase n=1 Tax=Oceanicella actignis TaxID=1189325 RepID=UPI0011E6A0B4|nr:type I polyketide synthase [Oceanicella actignis]TYO88771.1 acyl transferase domain-containing protein [Oceanicella actignis]